MIEKNKRWKEKDYTRWVATLPCCNCGIHDDTIVAHHLKHSLPNSVDNPTNGWCLCRNHHKAYDSNRMIVELNGDFIRYDVHGNIIEPHGRIIYNDLHNVNSMFITLAREWHDRKK